MIPNNPFSRVVEAMSMFSRFMNDPIGAMMSRGLNVPENIRNNPGAILNYLSNSGRMTPEQYNQAEQMATMAQNFLGKKL